MDVDVRIRPCGGGWEYCDGKCVECPKAKYTVTNHT